MTLCATSAAWTAAGLVPRSSAAPMDLWWFRLPRHVGDPTEGGERMSSGQFMVMLDRGDYWQCAYLIRKRTDAQLREAGVKRRPNVPLL